MPSHNMVSQRAYSDDATTRLWSDDLALLNSGAVASVPGTHSPPRRRSIEHSKKRQRVVEKTKVSRQKHKSRRAERRKGEEDLDFLESGGLRDSNSPRMVELKTPWKQQFMGKKPIGNKYASKATLEAYYKAPVHFEKNGVRWVQDNRSAPFIDTTRHLELDSLNQSELVSAKEDDVGDVQHGREMSLSQVTGGDLTSRQIANDAMKQQSEPSPQIGEKSEIEAAEDLTKLVQNELVKQEELGKEKIEQEKAKQVKQEKLKQETSKQETSKQETSKQEKLKQGKSIKKQPPNTRDAEENARLLAVWQHGAEKAPLPPYLETIRRKYKMDSLTYRSYWRHVAGSMMTPQISGAYDRARILLRRTEIGKGNKRVILAEDGETKISLHMKLMIEAKKLRKEYEENEDRKTREEDRATEVDKAAVVDADGETFSADVGKDSASPRVEKLEGADPEALVMAMPKAKEDLEAMGTGDATNSTFTVRRVEQLSARQKWRLNKEKAAIALKREALIEERASRLAEKQMWVANSVHEVERDRKIREISGRRADVKIRIQNLLETLAIEEEKQRDAEEAREEAHRLAEEREERREGLGHVLDDALTEAGLREDFADIIPARNEVDAPSDLLDPRPGASNRSTTQKSLPEEEAKQERPELKILPISTQVATQSSSITGLSNGEAGPSNIFIDPSLTLNLNAPTKSLQRQIQRLEGRLSTSYPRMDAMPYVISLSENRNTLQTWLRILARRLKSRDDSVDEWTEEKTEVKVVLDQMVRDHDLNNEAARRMAKRWEDIVQKRAEALDDVEDGEKLDVNEDDGAEEVTLAGQSAELDIEAMKDAEDTLPSTEVEEELDMDEMNAGGMSFLNADEVEADEDIVSSDILAENQEVPLAAQNTELEVEETAKSVQETTTPSTEVIEEDLPVPPMDPAAAIEKKTKASALQAFHSRKHAEKSAQRAAKKAANLLITSSSRKDNTPIDDFIAKRLYSTSSRSPIDPSRDPSTSASTTESSPSTSAAESNPISAPASTPKPALPHLTSSGSAHMVSVSAKAHTVRTAIAVGTVYFSNPTPLSLISSASLKKGDVLAVSRIAGIMAAKKCPDLIPLCHPIPLTHVGVELKVLSATSSNSSSSSDVRASATTAQSTSAGRNDLGFGGVSVEAKVQCTGPTGVEMEALTAVMGAALSVVDMCKAVDKFQRVQDVRVVLKEGGKSGVWREEGWRSSVHE